MLRNIWTGLIKSSRREYFIFVSSRRSLSFRKKSLACLSKTLTKIYNISPAWRNTNKLPDSTWIQSALDCPCSTWWKEKNRWDEKELHKLKKGDQLVFKIWNCFPDSFGNMSNIATVFFFILWAGIPLRTSFQALTL